MSDHSMRGAGRGRRRPDATVIGLVGGSGDLARRMLLPGFFHLFVSGLLPERCRIVGLSLDDLDTDSYRDLARQSLDDHARVDVTDAAWSAFSQLLSFARFESADAVRAAVESAERAIGGEPRRMFHLAVPPSAAADVVKTLGEAGLADRDRTRVVMEKPFGVDLDSARALNASIHAVLDEDQLYRIDHFLGKEGVQNILALRFANAFLEPIYNRQHVDSIQIDVPEKLTIEGRASFYEHTGCLKDMITTHLLQVLGFVAMEPPTAFSADALHDEKAKVYRSLAPIDPADVVYGQYDGYRDEPGVAKGSTVETFVAAKVEIDSWRWAGVPIFLRTGKAMAQSRQVVTIVLKDPPRAMFPADSSVHDLRNALRFEIADPPGIALEFLGKRPGPTMEVQEAELDFAVGETQTEELLRPYERLFHDALIGERTLFTRADGIERIWEVATPLLERPPAVRPYPQGSWGPEAADALVGGRRWELGLRQ